MVSKDKVYIVTSKEQELKVLTKLEQEGLTWMYSLKKPTAYNPSNYPNIASFPYVLEVLGSGIIFGTLDELGHYDIVYDGREEEAVNPKMKISKEVYDALVEWKNDFEYFGLLYPSDISELYNNPVINRWWVQLDTEDASSPDNRLIAIIRWVNGEDVFEVKKTKKWVVRSKERDSDGDYWYVDSTNNLTYIVFYENDATKFDTKEEAESWANAHQEVIEVEE